AEPYRLEDATLDAFVQHYKGEPLPDALRAACRDQHGTYLPLLVRMAMTLRETSTQVELADIFHNYLRRQFDGLPEAARWCLDTYWKNGLRRQRFGGTKLQQGLLDAGILVPADVAKPPQEVQFFHDSIQTYLTAVGLAEEDVTNYTSLPRP